MTEGEAIAHPGVSGGMRAWNEAMNSSRDTRPSWHMSRRRIHAYTLSRTHKECKEVPSNVRVGRHALQFSQQVVVNKTIIGPYVHAGSGMHKGGENNLP